MVITAYLVMYYLKRSMFASAWQILEQSYPGNSDELIDNPPKYAEPYSEQALLERAEDLGLTVLMRRSREFGMYHLMTLDILCYLDDLCRLRGLQGHSLPRRQGQNVDVYTPQSCYLYFFARYVITP